MAKINRSACGNPQQVHCASMKVPTFLNSWVVRLCVVGALVAASTTCSTLRTDYVKKPTEATKPTVSSPATRKVEAQVDANGDQSGFRLLVTGPNALMSRIALADKAQHSIDLQYYIYFNDATGRLLSQRLLAAADRGVRVRMLLDDIGIVEEDKLLDALDAHPNIEVRLFNPFRFRHRSMLSKAGQFLLEGRRLNRRMHNKAYIVDGAQAIVGGRNIGDAYFDVGDEMFFRDLDALIIGPVVRQISTSFDEYWNDDSAFPVKAWSGKDATPEQLAEMRIELGKDAREFNQSAYAEALAWELPEGPSAEQAGGWYWGRARLIADVPEKVDPDEKKDAPRIDQKIVPLLIGAKQQILLISPYMIPSDSGVTMLGSMVKRGVEIHILTNSLAATDEPAVHAGYEAHRLDLLQGGVDLYEFRPIDGKEAESSAGTSSGSSLHTKAMVIDHNTVFIGSMNFDPRSRYLNTEMGVVAESPALAAAMEAYFASATKPEKSYHVTLEPVRPGSDRKVVRWRGTTNGKSVEYRHDPDTSIWKRMKVKMMRTLPIEGLL